MQAYSVWILVGHCGSYFESGYLQYRAVIDSPDHVALIFTPVSKLVSCWLICINYSQVHLQCQGPIKHIQQWQLIQAAARIVSPAI